MAERFVREHRVYRTKTRAGQRLRRPHLIGRVVAEVGWMFPGRADIRSPFVQHLPDGIVVRMLGRETSCMRL